MPGLKISEADRQRINPKFSCSKCNLLLSEPMQTPCGHLMCRACMENMLSLHNPTCPSDGTQLRREDIFPDAAIRRELKALILNCPNEHYCDWRGTYEDLQEHVKECLEMREEGQNDGNRPEFYLRPDEIDSNETPGFLC